MSNSKIIKNIVFGFGGQFTAIIFGLIIPRIFIVNYGSDINGLISTVSQIFSYMALLEAGIGQAARNALFKPFGDNNKNSINEIVSTAREYYRKFTIIYAFGVIVIAVALPFVLKTEVDCFTVFWVILFEGMSGVISFYFIETPSIIFLVDGKSYINNAINLLIRILGYIVKIAMSINGISIVVLQLAYFIVTITKVLLYNWYFENNYSWIKWVKTDRSFKLKDRGSYIITEVASTVFNSTDAIILSVFLSTQLASVYSVYNMIYSNIGLLLNAVYFSVVYVLGSAFHADMNRYIKLHDAFTSAFLGCMTALMSVCYVLTIPFISLYTNGVSDVNYLYPQLPFLFCAVQIISWSRYVSGNLTGMAGYAKQTSYISLIEAVLNITLSIVFVNKFGIVGVLLGTVLSLPLKVLWCSYISDVIVMKRSPFKSQAIIISNFLFFIGVVLLTKKIELTICTYGQFMIWGVVYTLIFGAGSLVVNLCANRESCSIIKEFFLKCKAKR